MFVSGRRLQKSKTYTNSPTSPSCVLSSRWEYGTLPGRKRKGTRVIWYRLKGCGTYFANLSRCTQTKATNSQHAGASNVRGLQTGRNTCCVCRRMNEGPRTKRSRPAAETVGLKNTSIENHIKVRYSRPGMQKRLCSYVPADPNIATISKASLSKKWKDLKQAGIDPIDHPSQARDSMVT